MKRYRLENYRGARKWAGKDSGMENVELWETKMAADWAE